jgi:hypothetical protein
MFLFRFHGYALRLAPSGAGLWASLGGLEPAGGLLGLLDILITRAPEEQASGHAPDGHGDPELGSDAQEPVFHGALACAVGERHAHGLICQRSDPRPQLLIERWVHAWPAAHAAGLLERHIFELDRGWLLGHKRNLLFAYMYT